MNKHNYKYCFVSDIIQEEPIIQSAYCSLLMINAQKANEIVYKICFLKDNW